MKKQFKLFITLTAILISTGVFAQSKYHSVQIQTTAVCGMCKATIEKALSETEGVKLALLNEKNKIVTVRYNPEMVTESAIKQVITSIGYAADELPANPEAYNKLHACCKKEAEAE
jgi:copper chaperone CopZ